jgi:GNAT superfamily N-acetyltransferase
MTAQAPRDSVGAFVGPWYGWWQGDALPELPPLPGFVAGPADDDRALVVLTGCDVAEVVGWRAAGQRSYLARVAGEAVGCGWSTWDKVKIGEIGLAFTLPPGDRYLWGFVTAERWRGQGIYPLLLQAILRHEGAEQCRYRIGHTPDNASSARGILKAGFGRVGDVYRRPDGRFVLDPAGPIERARAGAALLGAEAWEMDRDEYVTKRA